jgi:hypothetical protein
MAIPRLAGDFREYLKLLNSNNIEYLPIGGYGIHGYVRATNDLDVWVRRDLKNALAVENALREFGFAVIGLHRLRDNKLASGRAKDLSDLDNLPEPERD